ncbi:MAG: hypothetical protein ACRDGL_08965 [Candidatus Limnocylindrales bacterium]
MSQGWADRPDDELPARLEAAAASLDPDAARLERDRMSALTAFRQSQAEREAEPSRGAGRAGWLPARLRGPAAALGLAIAILAGGAGLVAAASGPGQPFYGLRLSIESLTLPPPGTVARFDANVDRLGARLHDAGDASAHGDAAGTTDALAAYDRILAETLVTDGAPAAQLADLQGLLDQQLQRLETLVATAPAAARPGLEQAIAAVRQARGEVGPPDHASPPGSHPPLSSPGPAQQTGPTLTPARGLPTPPPHAVPPPPPSPSAGAAGHSPGPP